MSSVTGVSFSVASEPCSVCRLNSWKEVAAYLRRSVRSARRWEKEEGLPVRHRIDDKGDSVYAFRPELDAWWMNISKNESALGGRLDSWKEIAACLLCSVRSARRWEKVEGLPVHRHSHGRGDSVYAFKADLDDWRNDRRSKLSARDGTAEIARVSQGPQTSALPAIFE
jgi:hypothetical protein